VLSTIAALLHVGNISFEAGAGEGDGEAEGAGHHDR
jgi:hypothetical protein